MRNRLPFFLLALPVSVWAQVPNYKVPSSEVFVATTNPYRMYWLRGNDTIGSPVRELTLEGQSWSREGSALRVLINQLTLDAGRRTTSDTFVVEPNGRVASINGKMPGVHSRVDFLLRLPTAPLAVGVTWMDTLSSTSAGVGGEHHYTIQRRYAVVAEVDTLGRHLQRISATGRVAYRDGWWVDSTKGTFYSIDVAGPVSESFLFDARAGQLVMRAWKMDLRGSGTIPSERVGTDTLRAGLLSEETQTLLEPALAKVVGRPLPAGDTSNTLDKGLLFVHTVHRIADTIEAGFGRNGGLVGTARVVFNKASPMSYRATWTDGFGSPQIERVERSGTLLIVSHHGVDTALALPASAWGIADYAMQELLVPVILSLPNDGASHRIAIYRPYAAHWDSGAVVIRNIGDARIAVVQMSGDKKPQAMLITSDGDYLYGENSDPVGAERAPRLGSSRRTKLEALMQQIRGR
jgi:hypothetical protein